MLKRSFFLLSLICISTNLFSDVFSDFQDLVDNLDKEDVSQENLEDSQDLSISGNNLHPTSKRHQGKETFIVEPDVAFSLRVQASTSGNKKISNIEIENLENFKVLRKAPSQKTTIINGVSSKSVSMEFTLLPKEKGVFHVGPFSAEIDGKVLKKESIVLDVKELDKKKLRNEICYAKLEAESLNPYVFQPFKVVLKIFAKEGVVRNAEVSLDSIPDFEVKELGQNETREIINNSYYRVVENSYLFTPTKSGSHEIPPITVYYVSQEESAQEQDPFSIFFSGFGQRLKEGFIRTNRLNLNVLELPGSEEDFDGVGDFKSLKAELNKKSFVANEPLNFKLILEGKGNFEQISHPKLNFPKGFKVYSSGSSFIPKSKSPGEQEGVKVFEYVLQVSGSGKKKNSKPEF